MCGYWLTSTGSEPQRATSRAQRGVGRVSARGRLTGGGVRVRTLPVFTLVLVHSQRRHCQLFPAKTTTEFVTNAKIQPELYL